MVFLKRMMLYERDTKAAGARVCDLACSGMCQQWRKNVHGKVICGLGQFPFLSARIGNRFHQGRREVVGR